MHLKSEQSYREAPEDDTDDMKLRRSVFILLVCCSALWVASSSVVKAPSPPPAAAGCDSMLAFSSEISSVSKVNGDIHSRSLSPWSWRSSTVKNRIPSTLWEAECSSSVCLSPNPGYKDGHNLNSVPVYQSVLVLTRQAGTRCYRASYQPVSVGCTCVRAKTNQA